MDADFKHLKDEPKHPFSVKTFVFGLCMGIILCGVFGKIIALFKTNTAPTVSTTALEPNAPSDKSEKSPSISSGDTAAPEFEFYQILSTGKHNYPVNKKAEKNDVIAKPLYLYIFQIGAFKRPLSANKLRDKLIALGIDATVQPVTLTGGEVFFRLRVGPYRNLDALEKVETTLKAHGFSYQLLRLTQEMISH